VAAAPAWTTRAVNLLVPLVALDLVVQYIAGLGTDAYAPMEGFTMNTDFGIYDLHWDNGFLLGILAIALVIVAVLSRQIRNVVPAIVALLAVLLAGISGMSFVNSTPNPPSATIAMGVAWLIAFAAVMTMFRFTRGGIGAPPAAASTPPASS
jgi:hypothetical protein